MPRPRVTGSKKSHVRGPHQCRSGVAHAAILHGLYFLTEGCGVVSTAGVDISTGGVGGDTMDSLPAVASDDVDTVETS